MQEMEAERDPLQKQLANIKQIFEEFADQFEAAANSLRDGQVPDPIPNIQLEAARKVVTDTFAAISSAGRPFEMEPLDPDSSLAVAGEYLERIIETREMIEMQRVQFEEARKIVAEAEALRHTTNPDELERVKLAIEAVIIELDSDNTEEAENLLNGNHPLTKLVAYARHRNTLNDEEYDSFRETIEEEFGRALLRDIDRGRVICEEPVEEAISQEEIPTHTIDIIEESSDISIEDDAEFEEEESEDEETVDPFDYEPVSEVEIEDDLLEDAEMNGKEDESSPLYAEFEAIEGEDTLLPFLEGDGMNFVNDEMPEATVSSNDEEDEENEEENL